MTIIKTIESYNFTCEAGPLEHCAEWIELKQMIAAQNHEAAGVSQNELRELGIGCRRHKSRNLETPCGHDHS